MHTSGSILRTFTERLRAFLDEPDVDAKFDNDYMIRHFMSPAMQDVISRVAMMSDNPILLRHTVTTVKGQQYYLIPPTVKEVWRLAVYDADGNVTREALPGGEFNPRGPKWGLEGNMLSIRPFPTQGEDIDLLYVPSGEIAVHLATDGWLDADDKTFNLTTGTPTLGTIDRRPNAYAGSWLRLIDSAHPIEERIIESHDVVNGHVVARLAFSHAPAPDTSTSVTSSSTSVQELLDYEIVPYLLEPMLEAVACRAAMKAGVGRKISQAHQRGLIMEYRSAIKTAHDNMSNLKVRFGKFFDRDTIDGRQAAGPLFPMLHVDPST